jgi:hypothetical protein
MLETKCKEITDKPDKYHKELDELKKVLHWLISGLGQHGLIMNDCEGLSWEWITKNYNV